MLPESAKIAILLEAKGDIVAAERDLREIETLQQRGVESIGDLEGMREACMDRWTFYAETIAALLPLKPEVLAQAHAAKQRTDGVADARAQVAQLVRRHDDYVSRWNSSCYCH